MTAARDAILQRARSYPYDAPHDSYCWVDGALHPFDPADRAGRTPVLAFGSNRAPERLVQKFGHLGSHRIPVEVAELHDFDVVYAAHISNYGAVPAMLQRKVGVTVRISVTWLDEAQLPVMHASEMHAANYVYARLDNVVLDLSGGGRMDHAFCYVGTRGHIPRQDGSPHALLAVHGEGRTQPGISTGEALEIVRNRVAPTQGPDAFILRLVRDDDWRRQVTQEIAKDAVAFDYPVTVITKGLG